MKICVKYVEYVECVGQKDSCKICRICVKYVECVGHEDLCKICINTHKKS